MNRTILVTALSIAVSQAGHATAHPAWGIAVDRQGCVYFADIDHGNHIWRIDAPDRLTSVVSGQHSHDLHLDHRGNLFVAHVAYIPDGQRWESRLLKFEPSGAPSSVIPPTTDRKQFWGNAFTLDRDGRVYFGYTNNPRAGETRDESLLLRRSSDGQVDVLAGSAAGHRDGAGRQTQFTGIYGLAWGPDGLLYVSDQDAVRRVTRDGVVTTLARGLVARRSATEPFTGSHHLYGLAVAPGGSVFVADHGSRRILKISAVGRVSTAAVAERPWAPTGVAAAGEDLFILEVGSTLARSLLGPRVRKITADGKVTSLAMVDE
jgi:sugar lactone lactonase YvrE